MKQIYHLIFILSALGLLFCGGCSQSGRRAGVKSNQNGTSIHAKTPPPAPHKTTVKMSKVNGVYEIPAEINGTPMAFILDTGAQLISVSENEINLLHKQGKFSLQDDVTGTGDFVDANGDITEGTIIVLRSVKIGDRTLTDVEASVVHNLKAPLLMGLSALEKFGQISIDYKKEELTFEQNP
jgi:aspartyl protease family protein